MSKNEFPVRMCCGCMQRRPKEELIRIVRMNESVSVDYSKKGSGRPAYICADAVCIEKAKKRKTFSRNLKCEISDNLYDELLKLADRK